ncbi:MAG: adenylosuccinate synthase [Thermoanaerobaculia bacterium]|jgi:adenylosuccinate synthase|nr:adenylosuccinate synthase [Thermoanaerobaculia bacterium]
MRAFVIVDLGFGDAGKGLLTDYLVRRTGARMVVRYNGGAQAGHNVVTPDGRHHTFAQFGSGTFVPGVRTFLSRDVVVHPTALLREELALRSAGVTDGFERLSISADALVITPYHQALGRMRELARGPAVHGTCGAGVGETVGHDRARLGEAIRVADLADRPRLCRKLGRIRDYAWSQVSELNSRFRAHECGKIEAAVFDRPDALERWCDETRRVVPLIGDENAWVRTTDSAVIFEGAQGVLLDEWHGFHPYTTWSTCTAAPAVQLLSQFAPDAEVCRIGVLRTYAVRHGAGPLPTETPDIAAPPEHNTFNAWQGAVRRGWFDGVLARYAAEADGGIDALAITHLDWLSRIGTWTYCDSYLPDLRLYSSAVRSLDRQEQMTSLLAKVRPVLRDSPAREEEVLEMIEHLTGKHVAFGSRGPSAGDVFIRRGNETVSRYDDASLAEVNAWL